MMAPIEVYEAQSLSKKIVRIVRIVLSYTEYINRTVWLKDCWDMFLLVMGACGFVGSRLYTRLCASVCTIQNG